MAPTSTFLLVNSRILAGGNLRVFGKISILMPLYFLFLKPGEHQFFLANFLFLLVRWCWIPVLEGSASGRERQARGRTAALEGMAVKVITGLSDILCMYSLSSIICLFYIHCIHMYIYIYTHMHMQYSSLWGKCRCNMFFSFCRREREAVGFHLCWGPPWDDLAKQKSVKMGLYPWGACHGLIPNGWMVFFFK